jgi:hypothetical protein
MKFEPHSRAALACRQSIRIGAAVLIPAVFAACDLADRSAGDTPTEPAVFVTSAASQGGLKELGSQLAEVRALSAKFHRFEASQDAGYTVLATACRDNQPIGAMGYHYLNPAFVDDVVRPLEPELVIYEPTKNGELRFVGLEYIIPYAIRPETDPPPEMFGEEFLQNAGDQLWMMHVWVGRQNPDGVLAIWNPKVSCDYAN